MKKGCPKTSWACKSFWWTLKFSSQTIPNASHLLAAAGQLREIIRNPDAAGRIAKWSVELMGEKLAYAPHKGIKSQILVDFIAEWTDTQLPPPQVQAECWTLYFDGSVMNLSGQARACSSSHASGST
jgi:hypothetical protein